MLAFEVLNKDSLSYLGKPLVGQLSGGWTQFLPLKQNPNWPATVPREFSSVACIIPSGTMTTASIKDAPWDLYCNAGFTYITECLSMTLCHLSTFLQEISLNIHQQLSSTHFFLHPSRLQTQDSVNDSAKFVA